MFVRRTTARGVDVSLDTVRGRFKLVIDCSVGFCMSRANSFVEYDRSGLSCDKYASGSKIDNQLSVSCVWFILHPIFSTIGFPTHVPIQDSHPPWRHHNLHQELLEPLSCSDRYRTFNFTQRFIVTQGYEVVPEHHHRCIKCLAM